MSQQHPDRALGLVWPPYGDKMAAEALIHYEGDIVIYVGEGRGGCTADDTFLELLDENFEMVRRVRIPRWSDIFDDLTIWKRKR